MKMTNQRIRIENRNITLVLSIPVAILAKLIQLYLLPIRYFFDGERMVGMMTGEGSMQAWSGYQTTVDIYEKVNFLGFTTVEQWSIFMGIVMTPIAIWMISKAKEMELRESIFALMAIGLLNIYVFGISKEAVQIVFFFFIYIIIKLPIRTTFIKVIGCAGIFYWESLFFRSYYIIMSVMSVALYFLMSFLKKKDNKIRKGKVVMAIILSIVLIFIFLYVGGLIDQSEYHKALSVRDSHNASGANTAIFNPIEVNGNYSIFMFDYIIAAIRMMLPIELLVKSPIYTPFVVYQGFILYYYVRALKKLKRIDDSVVVVVSCFSAYLLGSFIFEPDFGSWVRHESATFPILQMMAFDSSAYDKIGEQT